MIREWLLSKALKDKTVFFKNDNEYYLINDICFDNDFNEIIMTFIDRKEKPDEEIVKEKRFEVQINNNNHMDIVDWVESEEVEGICIYNDLGVFPFSSAVAVCNLLNELEDEKNQVKEENEKLESELNRIRKNYSTYHGIDIEESEWY